MPEIDIYTRQFCGYCSAAKRLLDSKGATYREFDATYEPQLRDEMVQRSGGGRTFPQIFIGGRHVGGSDDLHALDRSGKLDAMLKD